MRTIAHDPFARETLCRRTVRTADAITCAWCGSKRRDGRLYEYGTERDDRPGVSWDTGTPDRVTARREKLFCSKSCRNSYYF